MIPAHGQSLATVADKIRECVPDVSACFFDVVDRHVDVTDVGHLETIVRTGAWNTEQESYCEAEDPGRILET